MGGDNDLKPVAPHSLGKFNADLVCLLWRNLTVLEALEAVIADNLTRVAPSRFVDTPMLREEARKWHEFQIDIRKRYLLPRRSL